MQSQLVEGVKMAKQLGELTNESGAIIGDLQKRLRKETQVSYIFTLSLISGNRKPSVRGFIAVIYD